MNRRSMESFTSLVRADPLRSHCFLYTPEKMLKREDVAIAEEEEPNPEMPNEFLFQAKEEAICLLEVQENPSNPYLEVRNLLKLRRLGFSRKLSPHCLETMFDSQLPSPKSSPKMPPKLSLPHRRWHFFFFQNYPRGEGNCKAIERQKLSRGNFCPGPPFDPKIPPKKFMWVPFFASFPRK